jgi:hypothetical protein
MLVAIQPIAAEFAAGSWIVRQAPRYKEEHLKSAADKEKRDHEEISS